MLLYFVSIVLPPIGPFAKVGCGAAFWISIALTILGWIPGVIYAWCEYSLSLRWIVRGNADDAPQISSPSMDESE